MKPTQRDAHTSDEIDLTQFFQWIGRGFSRVGKSFLYGLASLRNQFVTNRLFFAGIIILGLALGALYSQLLKKEYYKTSLVLSCDYLNTPILENIINKLNLLCQEAAREGLSQELKLDSTLARSIQKFEFQPIVSEDDVIEVEVLRAQLSTLAPDKKDLVAEIIEQLRLDNKKSYQISVYVFDPEIVKSLETALISYFRESSYIRRRMEINNVNLKERREKLVTESKKLDSLKSVLFENYQQLGRTDRGSGNVYLGDEKLADPLAVFREDFNLFTEIEEIDTKLYIQSDFEVIEGFTTFKQPESAGLVEILFVSFWISVVMGYLIIGAWRFDRLLANYPTKP